jgi:microcompartment protein CcmK/EutM
VRLARVIGPVWGARHAPGLDGVKLLEVELCGGRPSARAEIGGRAVAVDGLGAGPGELVLIAHGSRVRDLTVGEGVPDKDVVVAIVDGVDG